jgi:hypothetical protein
MKGIEREALIIREVLRSVGGRRWVKDARHSRAGRKRVAQTPIYTGPCGGQIHANFEGNWEERRA